MKKWDNTLNELPADKNLNKLREYMVNRKNELYQLQLSTSDVILWWKLLELSATRLIIFNARRGSEVSTLLITDYEKRSNYDMKETEKEDLDEVE